MIQDEGPLIRLIIERFDDLNSRVDELKRDIAAKVDKHESDDIRRFDELKKEIEPLRNMKRSVASSAGIVVLVIQTLAEVARSYIGK